MNVKRLIIVIMLLYLHITLRLVLDMLLISLRNHSAASLAGTHRKHWLPQYCQQYGPYRRDRQFILRHKHLLCAASGL